MKYANAFVKFLALTLVLMLISAIFMPDSYTLTSSAKTKVEQKAVFNYLSDFQFWKNWSPLFKADSSAKIVEDQDQGFSWEGERIGKGSMTVQRKKTNESLEILVQFTEPREVSTSDIWSLETQADSTLVTWQSTGHLSYPMGRIFGLFLESQLQGQFDRALQSFVFHLDSIQGIQPEVKVDSTQTLGLDTIKTAIDSMP